MASYCERCGGQLGFGCLGTGTADCDLNMELKRDGVSPEVYRNSVADTWWYQEQNAPRSQKGNISSPEKISRGSSSVPAAGKSTTFPLQPGPAA
jgi:hypothetical protein